MNYRDLNVHWIEFCKYMPENKIEEHQHNFFHYIYVVSGEGNIVINREEYVLRHNRMYLIPPGTLHSFGNTGEDVLNTIELKFDLHDTPMSDKISHFPTHINVKNTPVKDILTIMHQESVGKSTFHDDICNIKTVELLTYLMRYILRQSATNATSNPKKKSAKISDIKTYIQDHLDQEITLQELADYVCLEKAYFLKKFKAVTGDTPMTYIQKLRLAKASDLLIYSDMNVTQVAAAAGFHSIHYFCKVFSKTMGVTPTQFRKINLES